MNGEAMRYIIVDADAKGRARIRRYMEKMGYAVPFDECEGATEAMEVLLERDVDLMFLNTGLTDMCAMKFLGALNKDMLTILTSESREYAQKAFEMDVVDYLKKPFTFERFVKAVNKCVSAAGNDNGMTLENARISEDAFIYVKGKDRVLKIFVKDICFVESTPSQLRIQTEDCQHVTQNSLSFLEEALASWPFTRISKDLLISIPKIRAFSSTTVELGNTCLYVSRNYRERLFSTLRYDWGVN